MASTFTDFRIISSNLPRSIERVKSEPVVSRETEYYLENISNVDTVDEFMADTRLLNYALKAHGLEEMSYAKAFIRKALTEGIQKDDAFANQLADGRYEQFVGTFNFEQHGDNATIFTKAQQGTVDKYLRQTLEEEAGQDNTGVRLALYFERQAPDLESYYSILADGALGQVVRTALGLPAELAATNIDKQVEIFKNRFDLEDFQDPEKLSRFLDRFTALWELENPSVGVSNITTLFSNFGGSGISNDLLLSINNLKLGGR